MKRLVSILLALVMVLALTACGGKDSGETTPPPADTSAPSDSGGEETPEEPAGPEPITLNIAYMPNYASLWGVRAAMEQGCFEEEGITVVLSEFPDGPSEIAAMESGKIDLAYIGKGAHRLCVLGNAVIFAPSSVHTTDKIVVHPDSGIESMEDLKDRKTANTLTSTYAAVAKKYGADVTGVDDLNQTFELLLNGRIDATLNAEVSYTDYMNAHPAAQIKIACLAPESTETAIPMRKGEETASLREAVNKALAEMKEDGTLSALSTKYFGEDISKPQ